MNKLKTAIPLILLKYLMLTVQCDICTVNFRGDTSLPNVVCVDFVHVGEISTGIHDGIVQSGTDGLMSSDPEFMTDMTDRH